MALFRKNFLLRNNRATFLLEALLAVLILSVGLVGLIRGLLSSLNAVKQSENYFLAILVADNAFVEIVRLNGQKVGAPVIIETGIKNFKVDVSVNASGAVNVPKSLKEAQIKVNWPDGAKQKEVKALTLVAGPSDEEN